MNEGWMADNVCLGLSILRSFLNVVQMWIQAVAIILPRVQQHFSGQFNYRPSLPSSSRSRNAVPDSYIGILSSSMFAGMMFGAVGWGTCIFFSSLMIAGL